MPLTAPPSSPPLHGTRSSSINILSSGQFSSPYLPYRTIIHAPKASTQKENQQNSFLNRLSSPIAASEGFEREYSELEKEDDDDDEGDEERSDRAIAALADEEFLEKELLFDSDSTSNSGLDESPVDSDSASNFNDSSTFYTRATNRQPVCHTPSSSSNSSSSYTREKLVRILNGDTPVPKQRWGMHRILATLTYHRKDPRGW